MEVVSECVQMRGSLICANMADLVPPLYYSSQQFAHIIETEAGTGNLGISEKGTSANRG